MGRNQNNKKVKKDEVPIEEELSEEVIDVDEEEEHEDNDFDGEADD